MPYSHFLAIALGLLISSIHANQALDEKVRSRAEKDAYISACLARVPEGTRANIDDHWHQLCKSSRGQRTLFNTKKKYQLEIKDGVVALSTTLCFTYRGKEAQRMATVEAIRETLPCMENFFARHGIKLNLNLRFGPNFHTWRECDHLVALHNDLEELNVNAERWATHRSLGHTIGTVPGLKNRCTLAIHELGHLFGLKDTYKSEKCQTRKRIMDSRDIMGPIFSLNPNIKKFYPYAIEELLAPLCDQ